jgi:hypothetical protein
MSDGVRLNRSVRYHESDQDINRPSGRAEFHLVGIQKVERDKSIKSLT